VRKEPGEFGMFIRRPVVDELCECLPARHHQTLNRRLTEIGELEP
jgi:hypothetical protein